MAEKSMLTQLDRVMVVKENDASLSPDEFRRLQLVELGMIRELDRVCRANNIKYVIIAGTLLGAVRHKGYIPWDDDADIGMLREDYEKFKAVRDQLNPDICYFQDHDTDPAYLWGYGKLRRTGTVHIRSGQEHIKCGNGIYIDVFPFDDIPKSLLGQILQDVDCFVNRKILWANVACRSERGFRRVWYQLLTCIKPDSVWKHMRRYIRKSDSKSDRRVRILLFPSFGKLYTHNLLSERLGMPKKWFLQLKDYEFEHEQFMGIGDSDAFLKWMYGDYYMTLPPPEKRIPKVSFSRIEF